MNFTDAKKKGASGIERMQIGGISNEKKLSIFKDTEWTTDLSGSTSKLLHGPTSSPVSVCEKMEKNFSFSQPLPPTLQAASTDIPTSTSEKSKNSIGQRPSGCSAAQRDAPRLLNREFIEKRLTRDTHKYRELFKTDIPLMPHES